MKKLTREKLIDMAIELARRREGTWGPSNSWAQFSWAFGNTNRETPKRREIFTQPLLNVHEMLSKEEMAYIAKALNITEEYKAIFPEGAMQSKD